MSFWLLFLLSERENNEITKQCSFGQTRREISRHDELQTRRKAFFVQWRSSIFATARVYDAANIKEEISSTSDRKKVLPLRHDGVCLSAHHY